MATEMRIAYLINHDIRRNDGVTVKIRAQIGEWKRQGEIVQVFSYVPEKGESILPADQFPRGNYLTSRLLRDHALLNAIEDFRPDLLYLRYDVWSVTIGELIRKYPVVAELNSIDINEMRLLWVEHRTVKSFLRYHSYRVLRNLVLTRLDGAIAVTREIAQHRAFRNHIRHSIVVPNGIDLQSFPVVKNRMIADEPLRLFFIGTPNQPWHGVDLIELIAEKVPDWEFHFVGFEKNNSNNCYYYGYQSVTRYLKILERCHICVGSMALSRNGMEEACPLKVREYLAYGFPVVLGYNDSAFLHRELPEWVFHFRQPATNDEIARLREFGERNRHRVVSRDETGMIDVRNLESKRLGFLKEIAQARK
jgi:hypothetical protein